MAESIEALSYMVMVAAAVYDLIYYRLRLPVTRLNPYVLAFIGWQMITAALSIDPVVSCWRVILTGGMIAVYFASLSLPMHHHTMSMICIMAMGVLMFEVIRFGAWGDERLGFWSFDNPNIASAVLIATLWYIPADWRWIPAMFTLFTVSRGAILAEFMVWAVNARYWQRITTLLIVSLAITVAVLGALRPATVIERTETWREAFGYFCERPLTGWGPGTYALLAINEPGHIHADSALATLLAESGIIGALLGLAIIVRVLIPFRFDSAAHSGLLAILVHNAVDYPLFFPQIIILFAVLLADVEGTHGA